MSPIEKNKEDFEYETGLYFTREPIRLLTELMPCGWLHNGEWQSLGRL